LNQSTSISKNIDQSEFDPINGMCLAQLILRFFLILTLTILMLLTQAMLYFREYLPLLVDLRSIKNSESTLRFSIRLSQFQAEIGIPIGRLIRSFNILTKFSLMLFFLENLFLAMKRASNLQGGVGSNYGSSSKKSRRDFRLIVFV